MLHVTPDIMEATYEFLRCLPPFKGWRLPHADGIEFKVVGAEHLCGLYEQIGPKHRISVSATTTVRTDSLVKVMAHEMIHLHQSLRHTDDGPEHNEQFHKLAKSVCRRHGFDPGLF